MRKTLLFLWMQDSDPDRPEKPTELLFRPLCDSWVLVHSTDNMEKLESSARDFVLHEILGVYGPQAVVSRLATALRAPDERGTSHILKQTFWFLTILLVQPHFAPYIASSRIFEALFTSVNHWAKNIDDVREVHRMRHHALGIAEYVFFL